MNESTMKKDAEMENLNIFLDPNIVIKNLMA